MTEDDKELLRLAAKAYWGDEIDDVVSIELSEYENAILYTHPDNQDHNGNDVAMRWNPLEEDADAFGLLARLHMWIQWRFDIQSVWVFVAGSGYQAIVLDLSDPGAAARMAIVKCAAEIGRKMQ